MQIWCCKEKLDSNMNPDERYMGSSPQAAKLWSTGFTDADTCSANDDAAGRKLQQWVEPENEGKRFAASPNCVICYANLNKNDGISSGHLENTKAAYHVNKALQKASECNNENVGLQHTKRHCVYPLRSDTNASFVNNTDDCANVGLSVGACRKRAAGRGFKLRTPYGELLGSTYEPDKTIGAVPNKCVFLNVDHPSLIMLLVQMDPHPFHAPS